jgi:predicted ABC-type ATPase
MGVQERIRTIRLLEKIKKQLEFCNEAGIYDATTIGGEEINKNIPDNAIKISGAAK